MKKKADAEDPFASDDDDKAAKSDLPKPDETKKPLAKGKGKKLVPKKKADEGDGFESDNEDNDDAERKERVKELKSKKGAVNVSKKRKSEENEENEDDLIHKKRKGGRK